MRYLCMVPLLALLLGACGDRPKSQGKPISSMFRNDGTLTFLGKDTSAITSISIEIADEPQERETGMMGRPTLGENNGMLFVFDEEQYLSFWMMNTMIPLDMIFINANMEIITIHRNAVPYSQDAYAADKFGRYVLEVNGGFCDRHGIEVGQKVEWTRTDN